MAYNILLSVSSLVFLLLKYLLLRGWTTWLMGAVDPTRVMAIVPIVLDAVNFVAVMHHQFRSYGGWSFALSDYYEMNITSRFDSPNMVSTLEYMT